ncbi:sulfotransferase family 2 domain-containing protein [Alteromonas sp. ASW11-19]|uniref:Sulfotransferase family 2 domain-containing protein n=1 Tax=Alteromonas salexigens TaxID=2982530 RepID=A0ABT2VS22_9ALTE|nr:sulfotransferase family 2 domain-containing protein [Alteromonas salexigens]MCU7556111.1 sulfotransferase family 2 domain-containing protein [Alteromonas salexigens]
MQELLKRQSEKYLAKFPRVFFCHVPKCAGVSLSKAIFSALYPALFKASRFSGHIDLTASRHSEALLDVDMMTAREVQLITHLSDKYRVYTNGHCIARPDVVSKFYKQWHFVTVLRDPVERFVSEYVYNRFKTSTWQKLDTGIDSYLASPSAQTSATTYARYFSGIAQPEAIQNDPETAARLAIDNLQRFSVCGTLSNMPRWQESFNQTFHTRIHIGNRNSSPNKQAYTEITGDAALLAQIKELCHTDQRIYDAVVDAQASA